MNISNSKIPPPPINACIPQDIDESRPSVQANEVGVKVKEKIKSEK